MKTLSPEQKRIVYLALIELSEKQERILDQHAFTPDVEDSLKQSEAILDDIGSLLSIFSKTDEPSYVIDNESMNNLQKAITYGENAYNTKKEYPQMAGNLMSVVDTFKRILKDYSI